MLSNCGAGEDSWESLGQRRDQTSQSERKSILNIHWWTDAEAEAPKLWPPDVKSWLIWKDPDAGKDWKQEEKGMTKDEMVEWLHRLNGHEFEQAPGVGDGQGNLACCSPWGCNESDTTEWVNWTEFYHLERKSNILAFHSHFWKQKYCIWYCFPYFHIIKIILPVNCYLNLFTLGEPNPRKPMTGTGRAI